MEVTLHFVLRDVSNGFIKKGLFDTRLTLKDKGFPFHPVLVPTLFLSPSLCSFTERRPRVEPGSCCGLIKSPTITEHSAAFPPLVGPGKKQKTVLSRTASSPASSCSFRRSRGQGEHTQPADPGHRHLDGGWRSTGGWCWEC